MKDSSITQWKYLYISVFQYANKYGIRAYVTGHTEASSDGLNKVQIGSSIYTK